MNPLYEQKPLEEALDQIAEKYNLCFSDPKIIRYAHPAPYKIKSADGRPEIIYTWFVNGMPQESVSIRHMAPGIRSCISMWTHNNSILISSSDSVLIKKIREQTREIREEPPYYVLGLASAPEEMDYLNLIEKVLDYMAVHV
ncbi:hypothetical protein JXC34_02940 [Candidatus Woesearchaeota archaeon]|nr:hypothetical protein [Candidatus Woesearchaeota archaeon]